MAGTYTEVAQQDDDRNDGASPPISLSPALSPSPMPLLQSVKSTFTPISMDSESYERLDHEDEMGEFHDNEDERADNATSKTAMASPDAAALAQSVGASARATAPKGPTPINTEPDVASAPSGAVDTASSGRSSPISNLVNTRSHVSQDTIAASPTSAHQSLSPKATVGHHHDDFDCTSTKSSAPADDSSELQQQQQPVVVKPKPLIRTASTKGVKIIHPSPSVRSRSSSHASNIAVLEATAEKLSRTSSIESAIRDLNEEQKRIDSRRSSLLQASVSTGFGPEAKEPFPFTRQVSSTSSILDTNNAARHGGYSPAGYVMSPNHSLRSNQSRLRSTSHPHSEADSSDLLSRHGPGKSSTRSAKSTKPSLTDIAEMEPTGLTLAAMDEADRLQEHPEEQQELQVSPVEDAHPTPSAASHNGPSATDYWGNKDAGAQVEHVPHGQRPRSPTGSVGTFDQAADAFADFDGAHCSPEAEEDSFQAPFDLDLSLRLPADEPRQPGRPIISAPMNPTVRPTSYLDPTTGQQMMYYPARVPMMLNLPQKLSKNPKAAVRNQRRSQVLSMMPEATRQSAAWLPEVVPEPMFDPLNSGSNSEIPTPLLGPESPPPEEAGALLSAEDDTASQARPGPQPVNSEARKSRLSVLDPSDKRKSRMSYNIDNLPPQLRASAFFDMPSESPAIELKDGSAMATLDSILDASAKAPVSAFTDHSFAGKLGNEIYGVDKRKSHVKRNSSANALDVKKRRSIFHLRAPSKISIRSTSKEEKQSNMTSPRLGSDHGSESGDDEHSKLASGAEDEDNESGNEEDSDIDPATHGPPTTLLAELQIRKYQQKQRTRAPAQLYPNGMHSTLLEIDTLAEMERQNRKGKKVNLAWEGPKDAADESDDEDVPLGLLPVKQNGAMKMRGFQNEANRPLGLMEQRTLDDNEPLSHRRNRLQGRPTLAARQSLMALSGGGALGMSGGLGPPSPGLRIHTPEEDEHEGETLGERKRRLAAQDAENPLPQARPVSTAFSSELLTQLGDTFKEDAVSDNSGAKGKEKAAPAEEEETLGQRRRRLQAEREAREKEMGAGAPLQIPAAPMITKRHSMADVLGATRRTVLTDPRADTERARQEEAHRFRKSQDMKLAGFRAQIPDNLSTPNLQRSGGYMAGQYNDGTAGGFGRGGSRLQHSSSFQAPTMQHMSTNNGIGGMMMGNNAYGMGGVGGYNGMQNNGYGHNVLGYNGMPLQLPMPMQQPGQQYDRVDRWRQSIVP